MDLEIEEIVSTIKVTTTEVDKEDSVIEDKVTLETTETIETTGISENTGI